MAQNIIKMQENKKLHGEITQLREKQQSIAHMLEPLQDEALQVAE